MPLLPFLRLSAIAIWVAPLVPDSALAQPDDLLPPPQTAGIAVPDGQIEQAIEQLDALAESLLERSGIPGMAVAVVHDGEIPYASGFGVRQIDEDAPVEPETVFQIASLSKSVSATVVARQIDQGLVRWDTPVAELVPWFTLSDPAVGEQVTIGDLFAHRSGLPDHAGDDLEDLGFDRRTILERLKYLPLEPFRISYAYTNFGLTAAAEAVAAATGKAWEDVAAQSLYHPLGMTSTSSRYADFQEQANKARGHVATPDGFQPLLERQPDAQSAAGGVSSTVLDLARWMGMLLDEGRLEGETFISAEALLPAITPQIISSPAYAPDARPGFYGYGFDVGSEPSGRVRIAHSGAFYLGSSTNFLLLPSLDVGIVVLTNASPTGAAEALAMEFADLVQYGTITRDWFEGYSQLMAPMLAPVGQLVDMEAPAEATPPAELASYAGLYENDYFGEAEVRLEEEQLRLVLGPERQASPLTHWNGDAFTYAPFGENAPLGSLSEVAFTASQGRAEAMTIEFLDSYGLGTFSRVD